MARFLQFDNVAFSCLGMAEPLLGGVTAHFPEGAWTGIVGANGAGKTTLLKLAAGVLLADRGTHPPDRQRAVRRPALAADAIRHHSSLDHGKQYPRPNLTVKHDKTQVKGEKEQ